ncbi:hypothetical protein MRBBS_1624 [Marinobacter sp. BSs20148]|nr:hypothetical protein MRBBS_1624 [Marinobacter sp. BSs20148]
MKITFELSRRFEAAAENRSAAALGYISWGRRRKVSNEIHFIDPYIDCKHPVAIAVRPDNICGKVQS